MQRTDSTIENMKSKLKPLTFVIAFQGGGQMVENGVGMGDNSMEAVVMGVDTGDGMMLKYYMPLTQL